MLGVVQPKGKKKRHWKSLIKVKAALLRPNESFETILMSQGQSCASQRDWKSFARLAEDRDPA